MTEWIVIVLLIAMGAVGLNLAWAFGRRIDAFRAKLKAQKDRKP